MNHFQLYYNNHVYADMPDLTLSWAYVYLQQDLLGWLMYLNSGNVISGNDNNMSFSAQCLVSLVQVAPPVNRSLRDRYLNYFLFAASLCSLV